MIWPVQSSEKRFEQVLKESACRGSGVAKDGAPLLIRDDGLSRCDGVGRVASCRTSSAASRWVRRIYPIVIWAKARGGLLPLSVGGDHLDPVSTWCSGQSVLLAKRQNLFGLESQPTFVSGEPPTEQQPPSLHSHSPQLC